MSCCSQDAVRIQAEDFSQEEEIRALRASSNGIGGIVTFLGCARDFSEGREVSQISFDASSACCYRNSISCATKRWRVSS